MGNITSASTRPRSLNLVSLTTSRPLISRRGMYPSVPGKSARRRLFCSPQCQRHDVSSGKMRHRSLYARICAARRSLCGIGTEACRVLGNSSGIHRFTSVVALERTYERLVLSWYILGLCRGSAGASSPSRYQLKYTARTVKEVCSSPQGGCGRISRFFSEIMLINSYTCSRLAQISELIVEDTNPVLLPSLATNTPA